MRAECVQKHTGVTLAKEQRKGSVIARDEVWGIGNSATSGLSNLCKDFAFFQQCHMWDLSFPTRDRVHTPCIGRQTLNHWTAKEVPAFPFCVPMGLCGLEPLPWVTALLSAQ